jgi:hypothetical protein
MSPQATYSKKKKARLRRAFFFLLQALRYTSYTSLKTQDSRSKKKQYWIPDIFGVPKIPG